MPTKIFFKQELKNRSSIALDTFFGKHTKKKITICTINEEIKSDKYATLRKYRKKGLDIYTPMLY